MLARQTVVDTFVVLVSHAPAVCALLVPVPLLGSIAHVTSVENFRVCLGCRLDSLSQGAVAVHVVEMCRVFAVRQLLSSSVVISITAIVVAIAAATFITTARIAHAVELGRVSHARGANATGTANSACF